MNVSFKNKVVCNSPWFDAVVQLTIFFPFRSMIYGYTSMIHNTNYSKFDFQKCLMFGSLISATDPGN